MSAILIALFMAQRIVLPPALPLIAEQVNVTATRGELRVADTPESVTVLTGDVLDSSPSPVLDQTLRQVPGFTLFRRTDSRTANPTSQGVSLRGLGASGASRALVLDDGIPLNDPFGGWVYWDRVPAALLERVEVLEGGGSNLYGSGALGGVVNMIRRSAGRPTFDLQSSAGSLGSAQLGATGGGQAGHWSGALSAEAFTTAGYVAVAPAQRGPVDTAARSRHGVVDLSVRRHGIAAGQAFARVSAFSETRGNGTPLQNNDTGIIQLAGGGQWPLLGGGLEARAYGTAERFNQTFSAVSADRRSEKLTGTQHVPADGAGGSLQWSRAAGMNLLVGGIEFNRTSGSTIESTPGLVITSFANRGGRQETAALFVGDTVALASRFSLTGSIRVDRWTNSTGHALTWTSANPLPATIGFAARTDSALSPRLSAIYRASAGIAVTASAYRAFRAPTLNELYRSFRVGNVLTEANEALQAERVSGAEAGVRLTPSGSRFFATGRLFWMDMTQPVANVTLALSPTLILRQRQNLGSIRSRGVEVETEVRVLPNLVAHASYLFDDAEVTSFPASAALVGRRVPQQPAHGATLRVQFADPRLATIAVRARWVGEQYDDDLNQFALASYGAIDAYASRRLTRAMELFAAGENLTNRQYEIARTPVTMLGWPRSFRIGLRLRLGL